MCWPSSDGDKTVDKELVRNWFDLGWLNCRTYSIKWRLQCINKICFSEREMFSTRMNLIVKIWLRQPGKFADLFRRWRPSAVIVHHQCPFHRLCPYMPSKMFSTLRKAGTMARVSILIFIVNLLDSSQSASAGQRRYLSIHEHQSMKLLNSVSKLHSYLFVTYAPLYFKYGIPTPKSVAANTPQEAYEVAKNFGNHKTTISYSVF